MVIILKHPFRNKKNGRLHTNVNGMYLNERVVGLAVGGAAGAGRRSYVERGRPRRLKLVYHSKQLLNTQY